ncbi:MAG: hypothetical protein JEY99_03975 [Spirochaetales bacterium]|nr:hypothetical protein [Spirochaetales bacterium]
MVFRVKGNIAKTDFHKAIDSMRIKHPLLNSIQIIDEKGRKVFKQEKQSNIDLEIIPRDSDKQWMDVYHKHCNTPFEFDKKPCIRFSLIQSDEVCELLIFSHHIICDGLSLAYLGRDILESIGNQSDKEPEVLDTIPVAKTNFSEELKLNGFMKNILKKMNMKFLADREYFDFDNYKELHEAYWNNFSHKMLPAVLSEAETSEIIASCKKNEVSVNSAIAAAIAGARKSSLNISKLPSRQAVAVSIRNNIQNNPMQGMGFYAGSIDPSFTYNQNTDFWNNAAKFHKKVKSRMKVKHIFKNLQNWSYLDPRIMESLNFKILGSLCRNSKLNYYSRKKDLVASLVRREKMNSLDNIIMSTAITNIGKLNFKGQYGDSKLDSIVMNPGGAFPLVQVQLVIAVATVSGKMSILFEYEKSRLSDEQAQRVMDKTIKILKSK